MEEITTYDKLFRKVLKDGYETFKISNLCYTKNENEPAEIKFKLSSNLEERKEQEIVCRDDGGFVSSLHKNILLCLAGDNLKSPLHQIVFIDTFINSLRHEGKVDPIKSASGEIVAKIIISNTLIPKKKLIFTHTDGSLIDAIVNVVAKVFEFFVNSERAFEVCYKCFRDAQKRKRIELTSTYLTMLSEIVKVSCYEENVKTLKKELERAENAKR